MLVLLIIFMITAPILQSGIEVELPKTKTVKEISEDRLVVTIDRGQRVYLGNEPVNIRELGKKILAQSPDARTRAIYLRSDAAVPFGSFATVMDALHQAGITQVSVVTEPLGARGKGN
jgi:biopolymer transport protein ExbD/biopolymer transport protein TolR